MNIYQLTCDMKIYNQMQTFLLKLCLCTLEKNFKKIDIILVRIPGGGILSWHYQWRLWNHRVIILNRGNMHCKKTGRKWCNSSRPQCATWRHSSMCNAEVCILRSPGIAASPISLLSMGGVCGRSLTAGKILFTGRQTCSLYLALWLCAWNESLSNFFFQVRLMRCHLFARNFVLEFWIVAMASPIEGGDESIICSAVSSLKSSNFLIHGNQHYSITPITTLINIEAMTVFRFLFQWSEKLCYHKLFEW